MKISHSHVQYAVKSSEGVLGTQCYSTHMKYVLIVVTVITVAGAWWFFSDTEETTESFVTEEEEANNILGDAQVVAIATSSVVYHEDAAQLAWQRTMEFLERELASGNDQ